MIEEMIIKYALLLGVFFAVFSISGFMIEKQEKRECQEYRHRFDEEKQQITDEIERAYNELFN